MATKKTKSRKKKASSKKKQQTSRLKLVLGALLVLLFLIGVLALLAHYRERLRSSDSVPAQSSDLQKQLLYDSAAEEVQKILLPGDMDFPGPRAVFNKVVTRTFDAPFPSRELLRELESRLGYLNTEIGVEKRGDQLVIRWRGYVWFVFLYRPLSKPDPFPLPSSSLKTARVAILVDDLGVDLSTMRKLISTGLDVTVAVLPDAENAAAVARLAHKKGRQVIIHIPMEPLSYPATDPGSNALLTSLSDEEIRRRFQGYISKVPHAVGGNNHMGSRFTESRANMKVVLDEMKREGLFFVDSRTTPNSVAFKLARSKEIPSVSRNLFLDNVRSVDAIYGELRKLVRLAKKQGKAVGICHPYPETLAALNKARPLLQGQGVKMVPVSELLIR